MSLEPGRRATPAPLRWRPDPGYPPDRFSALPFLVGLATGGILVHQLWRSQFGLSSFALVAIALFILILVGAYIIAFAVAALIFGHWRRTLSDLVGVGSAVAVLCASFTVPIESTFTWVARPHYEAELADRALQSGSDRASLRSGA
jgi:hypothetical protein